MSIETIIPDAQSHFLQAATPLRETLSNSETVKPTIVEVTNALEEENVVMLANDAALLQRRGILVNAERIVVLLSAAAAIYLGGAGIATAGKMENTRSPGEVTGYSLVDPAALEPPAYAYQSREATSTIVALEDPSSEVSSKELVAEGGITVYNPATWDQEMWVRYGIAPPEGSGYSPKKPSLKIDSEILNKHPELLEKAKRHEIIAIFPGIISKEYADAMTAIYKQAQAEGLDDEQLKARIIENTDKLNKIVREDVLGTSLILRDPISGHEEGVSVFGCFSAVDAAKHMGLLPEDGVAKNFVADVHPDFLKRFDITYEDGVFTYDKTGKVVSKPPFEVYIQENSGTTKP